MNEPVRAAHAHRREGSTARSEGTHTQTHVAGEPDAADVEQDTHRQMRACSAAIQLGSFVQDVFLRSESPQRFLREEGFVQSSDCLDGGTDASPAANHVSHGLYSLPCTSGHLCDMVVLLWVDFPALSWTVLNFDGEVQHAQSDESIGCPPRGFHERDFYPPKATQREDLAC